MDRKYHKQTSKCFRATKRHVSRRPRLDYAYSSTQVVRESGKQRINSECLHGQFYDGQNWHQKATMRYREKETRKSFGQGQVRASSSNRPSGGYSVDLRPVQGRTVGESASRAVKESIEHVLTQPSTLSPVSISGPPITTGPLHQDPERAGVPLLRLPRTHRGLLQTLTDCRPRSGGVRRNESGRDATTRPRLCWQVGAGGPAYHPVKIPQFSLFNSYNGT